MDKETTEALVGAVFGTKFGVMTYSGRYMYGDKCLAFLVPNLASAVELGSLVGVQAVKMGRPLPMPTATDNLGLGNVVYYHHDTLDDEAYKFLLEVEEEQEALL